MRWRLIPVFDHFLGARGCGDEKSAVVMVEDPPPPVLLGLPAGPSRRIAGKRSLSDDLPREAKSRKIV
jgi:hypothetical protein